MGSVDSFPRRCFFSKLWNFSRWLATMYYFLNKPKRSTSSGDGVSLPGIVVFYTPPGGPAGFYFTFFHSKSMFSGDLLRFHEFNKDLLRFRDIVQTLEWSEICALKGQSLGRWFLTCSLKKLVYSTKTPEVATPVRKTHSIVDFLLIDRIPPFHVNPQAHDWGRSWILLNGRSSMLDIARAALHSFDEIVGSSI